MEDTSVLHRIKQLIDEEGNLYSKSHLTDQEVESLHQMKVELDQCWDFLRQRRALRDAGKDPDNAEVRPPNIVENYKQ
jgi:flagellar biosynthesis/type III secretory pathway chaperone